jgi:hypothetical protein
MHRAATGTLLLSGRSLQNRLLEIRVLLVGIRQQQGTLCSESLEKFALFGLNVI